MPGFLDAITTAIHDTTNNPSVMSISWGGAGVDLDTAGDDRHGRGVPGGGGAGRHGLRRRRRQRLIDGVTDGGDHVDFPASSPHVLACGGTSLTAAGTAIASEAVWNDGANGGATGGGVSSFFAVPAWQHGLSDAHHGGITRR